MTMRFALSAFAAAMIAVPVQAQIKPAVTFDVGGKFDKSFNEAAYNGAEAFKKKTGIAYREFEIQNDSQREQAFTRFARDGNDPIIAIGFSNGNALKKVAEQFPNTRFAIIDFVIDLPNVASIVFKEHEGSYLVGLAAAKASKSGKVGFVGGMDIPLIRKFACGYVQGVKAGNASAEIFQNMTGTTGAAFNDPLKGAELAKSQIGRGADVIYHAAGNTGSGVLRAAADANILGIGVDSNQNGMHPGKVLTSMLKRVDVAVETVLTAAHEGKWKAGVTVLGLAEGGVDWAQDDNNKALVSADMKAAIEKASADIKSGAVKVHDYMADQKCPVQ